MQATISHLHESDLPLQERHHALFPISVVIPGIVVPGVIIPGVIVPGVIIPGVVVPGVVVPGTVGITVPDILPELCRQ
jgi:hypothetical protein